MLGVSVFVELWKWSQSIVFAPHSVCGISIVCHRRVCWRSSSTRYLSLLERSNKISHSTWTTNLLQICHKYTVWSFVCAKRPFIRWRRRRGWQADLCFCKILECSAVGCAFVWATLAVAEMNVCTHVAIKWRAYSWSCPRTPSPHTHTANENPHRQMGFQ